MFSYLSSTWSSKETSENQDAQRLPDPEPPRHAIEHQATHTPSPRVGENPLLNDTVPNALRHPPVTAFNPLGELNPQDNPRQSLETHEVLTQQFDDKKFRSSLQESAMSDSPLYDSISQGSTDKLYPYKDPLARLSDQPKAILEQIFSAENYRFTSKRDAIQTLINEQNPEQAGIYLLSTLTQNPEFIDELVKPFFEILETLLKHDYSDQKALTFNLLQTWNHHHKLNPRDVDSRLESLIALDLNQTITLLTQLKRSNTQSKTKKFYTVNAEAINSSDKLIQAMQAYCQLKYAQALLNKNPFSAYERTIKQIDQLKRLWVSDQNRSGKAIITIGTFLATHHQALAVGLIHALCDQSPKNLNKKLKAKNPIHWLPEKNKPWILGSLKTRGLKEFERSMTCAKSITIKIGAQNQSLALKIAQCLVDATAAHDQKHSGKNLLFKQEVRNCASQICDFLEAQGLSASVIPIRLALADLPAPS